MATPHGNENDDDSEKEENRNLEGQKKPAALEEEDDAAAKLMEAIMRAQEEEEEEEGQERSGISEDGPAAAGAQERGGVGVGNDNNGEGVGGEEGNEDEEEADDEDAARALEAAAAAAAAGQEGMRTTTNAKSLLRRLPYTQVSFWLVALLFQYSLRRQEQFFLAMSYLASSRVAYAIVGNAMIAAALWIFRTSTRLFLSSLRPLERESIWDLARWNFTETCIALAMFRDELDVATGTMFLLLLLAKCLHWAAEFRCRHVRTTEDAFVLPEDDEDHLNEANLTPTPISDADDSTPASPQEESNVELKRQGWWSTILCAIIGRPPPSSSSPPKRPALPRYRWSHVKLVTMMWVLLILDGWALFVGFRSIATEGASVVLLFAFEAAILGVSAMATLALYYLHFIDGWMQVLQYLVTTSSGTNTTTGAAAQDGTDNVVAIDAAASNSATEGREASATTSTEGETTQQQDDPATASTASTPSPRPKTRRSWVRRLVDGMTARWREHKATLVFGVELLQVGATFEFYLAFFVAICTWYSPPLSIVREVYVSFHQLRQKIASFVAYRRVVDSMNRRFETVYDPPEEEACIICRDALDGQGAGGLCKRLPGCGHVFHGNCLREWLVQQQTCPTCRADIQANEARAARQQRDADAAAAAAEAQEPPAQAQREDDDGGEQADARARALPMAQEGQQAQEDGPRAPPPPPPAQGAATAPRDRTTFPATPPRANSMPISTASTAVPANTSRRATPKPKAATFPSLYKVTCPGGATVRSSPSPRTTILRSVSRGTLLVGLERTTSEEGGEEQAASAEDNKGGLWVNIPGGGWVWEEHLSFVMPLSTSTVTGASTAARTASLQYPASLQMPQEQIS